MVLVFAHEVRTQEAAEALVCVRWEFLNPAQALVINQQFCGF